MVSPAAISINFSDLCNLHCIMCDDLIRPNKNSIIRLIKNSILNEKSRPVLSFSQTIIILKKLKKWLGNYQIALSGKEPFCNQNIFKLLEFCNKNDIRLFINSNGTLFTKKVIKNVCKYKNIEIVFSLDSVDPNIHNHIRGNPHAYTKLISTISELIKGGFLNIYIRTTINKLNIDKLESVLEFAHQNRIRGVYFQPYIMTDLSKYKQLKNNELWPSSKLTDFWINKLISLKNEKYKDLIKNTIFDFKYFKEYFSNPPGRALKCHANINSFRIDRYGDVGFCYNRKSIYGNVLDNDLQKMFENRDVKKLKRILNNCDLTCKMLNCSQRKLIKKLSHP